jgi:hypothetical protein
MAGCSGAARTVMQITSTTRGRARSGTRYRFTALHRIAADFEKNKVSGWQQRTAIAIDQFVEHVPGMRRCRASASPAALFLWRRKVHGLHADLRVRIRFAAGLRAERPVRGDTPNQ